MGTGDDWRKVVDGYRRRREHLFDIGVDCSTVYKGTWKNDYAGISFEEIMASFPLQWGAHSMRKCTGKMCAAVVRMMLLLSIVGTVTGVDVDNVMSEVQVQHAVRMASVPLAHEDVQLGDDVMALHPVSGQMWPGDINSEEVGLDGTVTLGVIFLDHSYGDVRLQNVHHRDDTVSYDNWGVLAPLRSSMNLDRSHRPVMRAGVGGGSAAAAAAVDSAAAVGSVSEASSALGGGDLHDPHAPGTTGVVEPHVLLDALDALLDRFARERNVARAALDVAVRERDLGVRQLATAATDLTRRTGELRGMQLERDAALAARGQAVQDSSTEGAAGKKRKIDEPGSANDWERQAALFENERDVAIEARNHALDERYATTAWQEMQLDRDNAHAIRDSAVRDATRATQRALASDLRATAAEDRATMMQQELRNAQAELARLRRATADDHSVCRDGKDAGPRG